MITRILVPTDFSKVADNALKFALKFAQKTQAEVLLLHVNNIPVTDAYFTADSYFPYLKAMEADTQKEFEKLKKKRYKNTNIKFQSTAVMGGIYDEICAFAQKEKTDLIIMGTTGASGLSELLFGSVTASMISKSPIPMLIIPPSAKYDEFNHIVYATDYNEPEFPAVSRLTYLAQLYKSKVTVLHVKSEVDKYFNSEQNFFVKNRKNISYKKWELVKIDDKNPMRGINRYMKQFQTNLLVLARHNRSFFDRIFHRSLSKRMAYHIDIPLLILTEQH